MTKNKKPKKIKPSKKRGFTLKRFFTFAALFAACIFAGVQIYYLMHFRLYKGYTKYLTHYKVEEAALLTLLNGEDVPGMNLVAESAHLRLYTNTTTAEVAVFDKRTGQVVYSNPQNADIDTVANLTNKSLLKSQLVIEYYSAKRTYGTFNTYDDAVNKDEPQFEYEGIANGIRYIYTMGDFSSSTGIVPIYLSEARLLELTSQMSDTNAEYVRGRYGPWSGREGYRMLNDSARGWVQIERIESALIDIGYTEEDFINDMTASGAEDELPLSFVVPLEYRLFDDYLEVCVPSRLIEEGGGGRISRIQLLRYFGAAGADEEGYILLPNGAGSLVYFNNGKAHTESYSQFVYGIDPLIAEYVVTEQTDKIRLPVFGFYREPFSMLVTIEECESLASISAAVSGMVNSYNFAYPTFILRSGERLTMFGATDLNAELPIVENEYYDVNFRTRYYFLTNEYANGYSGMANFYREKLQNEGKLPQTPVPLGDIPFYMDIAGGVLGEGFFLGAQYYKTIPMTTFAEAEKISAELNALGVNAQVINYQGWFNRGYYHDVPDKINVINKLGGKRGLSDLTRAVEANGGRVYGDVVFQNVTFASRRFNWRLESSRYYGAGYVAAFGQVHPVLNMQTSSMGYTEILYNLLSPKFLNRYVDAFSEEITNIDITGISLRDLGDALHSDKRRTELIDRSQAQNIVTAQFETLNATNKPIMVNGGNLYSLAYAGDILGAPLSHNAFFLMDEEVPFYQMVISGYINYAGESINLNSTKEPLDIALKLIETGASPRYTFTWQNSSELKKTGLNEYRSTTFENWKEHAAAVYELTNSALLAVNGSSMIYHEIISGGVTLCRYANGVTITVNANSYPVVVGGEQIPPKSWRVS